MRVPGYRPNGAFAVTRAPRACWRSCSVLNRRFGPLRRPVSRPTTLRWVILRSAGWRRLDKTADADRVLSARNHVYLGCHLLSLLHASKNDQVVLRDQQPAMIHGRIGGLVGERFPFAAAHIKSKRDRRRFGGLAVVANAVVIVRIVGASRKIDPMFRRTRCDPIHAVAVWGR